MKPVRILIVEDDLALLAALIGHDVTGMEIGRVVELPSEGHLGSRES